MHRHHIFVSFIFVQKRFVSRSIYFVASVHCNVPRRAVSVSTKNGIRRQGTRTWLVCSACCLPTRSRSPAPSRRRRGSCRRGRRSSPSHPSRCWHTRRTAP
uniref:Uncharacterized protein n=1 Tax=Arundo donax TaxID=35708 RepID=A0A0A8ZDS3_ARUDO